MSFAVIASSKDSAGMNIRNSLIRLFGFSESNEKFDENQIFKYSAINEGNVSLYLINEDLIFAESIDKKISADFYIFASKHRSKENTPSFAVHPIGNWGKAEFGGMEKKLCPSCADLLKGLYISLVQNSHFSGKNANFEATMEATHHGPYVEKPAVFIEIGSTEAEWSNPDNGEVIARTIMSCLLNQNKSTVYKNVIGIGGPHYCSNFNRIVLSTDIAISHICPKYMLDKLDEELIMQAVEKTAEKIDFALLDWKGMGTYRKNIVKLLEKIKIDYKKIHDIS